MTRNTIFTIGHSNHSLDTFLEFLLRNEIAALADVRSAPYSRFNPQFDRDTLATKREESIAIAVTKQAQRVAYVGGTAGSVKEG